MSKGEYKSRVYTDRPAYADYDPPAKIQAIQSIVAKHLKQLERLGKRLRAVGWEDEDDGEV